VAALENILETDKWWEDSTLTNVAREPMVRWCATYLAMMAEGVGAIDPVAGFHLRNGARLERINWLGNVAPRGMEESFGLMANYLYDLAAIEANHEAFVREGIVPRSSAVGSLINPTPPPRRRTPRMPRRRVRASEHH
jgi:malonyl-CoA decarboxylase